MGGYKPLKKNSERADAGRFRDGSTVIEKTGIADLTDEEFSARLWSTMPTTEDVMARLRSRPEARR